MERKQINSECCFIGLKNDRLIYRCRDCKEKYKRPIERLIRKFNLNQFILLLRKGVHPYEDMDDWGKFDEATLPPKEAFYSKLNLNLKLAMKIIPHSIWN